MSTIVLITGGSRGLGYAAAAHLSRAGSTVIIGARRETAARRAIETLGVNHGAVDWVELDVTRPATVRSAAAAVQERYGRLDVLINNAGVLPEATDTGTHDLADPDTFRQTFETNVFGAVTVTEFFLPLLRLSDAGRIVNVSSTMGSLTDQNNSRSPYYSMFLPAYRSSKAALNSLTIELAKHLRDTSIKVTTVCPGFVQTELTPMNRQLAPLTADEAAHVVVSAATLPADAETGTFVDADGPVAW
ncbi:NADP-dependent 3-hydroxy acid dehydrogenase YdfG [Parafrankia irregularis]|uniref:NADP-dependent 3-hydroxy acid dehydrogenase YdfG n=1 Tax=Parafrankia irregularis TaxID=795642 RepID=A0A0S4QVC4_9ACTN|nr:SDR family NAD(P)-dependent oxidoreductase [Parafrankia irregularis]MBE3203720.1 SDR family NAD(P)-dependent oxidoreductase [Parafrankia sp. CH37]CUU59038.1 NADP-dependent 3-hydroxy acid dehydrogenase YdfG [Parafrankia irregularis]